MNLHEKNGTAVERWRLVEDLVETALVDTVYGDLYLQRARDFLAPALSESEFVDLQRLETEALNLPNRIFVAMKQANWIEVKDLSSRMSTLKRVLEGKGNLRQLGEKIYRPGEPPLDPFSPGLQGLASSGDPQTLLYKLSAQLERLQRADLNWQGFYAARRSAMAAVKTYSSEVPTEDDLSESQLENKAFKALESGNFEQLEKVATRMEGEEGGTERASGPSWNFVGKTSVLTFQFPPEVLNSARALGLSPVRMEADSRVFKLSREEFASLYRHLWHPSFIDKISREGGGQRKEIPLPANAPEGLRDLVEMYALHPFVNSGGARFIPLLTEEDVLVEDFDEPDPGRALQVSALLSSLGLEERRGLSRIKLEKALLDRGNAIVRDIGLDPLIFRLVCIPPDVYGRVGHQKGWGQKQLWTHFDGYMVTQNRTLSALAGGDVRFGGLYDLVGISREYDSDRIIARFAVVQRRRLETVG